MVGIECIELLAVGDIVVGVQHTTEQEAEVVVVMDKFHDGTSIADALFAKLETVGRVLMWDRLGLVLYLGEMRFHYLESQQYISSLLPGERSYLDKCFPSFTRPSTGLALLQVDTE